MNNLLESSISEGSTSTESSVELTGNKDLKVKQDDSIKSKACSKGTKWHSLSRGQDVTRSETQVLEFEDSQAVRNAVYQQWLLEKKVNIKEKKIKETKMKSLLQEEEAKAIAKKEQLKADAVKAYDNWKLKKDRDLVKKMKAKQQEKEREEEQVIKAKEKQQQAEQVIAIWQKKKDEKRKSFLTSQTRKHEEEKERLQQEAERKAVSKLAFDKWMENKRKVLSGTQINQKSNDHKKEEGSNTQSQHIAFEEWKKRKDKQLQKSTRKVEEKVHKQPWRPARSIEYDYLKPPQPLPNKKLKHDNTSSSTSSLSSQSSVKQTLKSVRVCCQTLEYWCTCQK